MSIADRATSPLVTPEMLRSELRKMDLQIGGMLAVVTGIILAALAIAAGAVIQAIG